MGQLTASMHRHHHTLPAIPSTHRSPNPLSTASYLKQRYILVATLPPTCGRKVDRPPDAQLPLMRGWPVHA